MEKFLLTDIIKLNRDINFDYRDSKQPLFIKNFILKQRRNKLRKIIDRNAGFCTKEQETIKMNLSKLHNCRDRKQSRSNE